MWATRRAWTLRRAVTEPPAALVECYAGASYPTEPRAVWWAGKRQPVARVIARWRAPDGPGFNVETKSGTRFRLDYDMLADRWQIKLLDAEETKGKGTPDAG